MEHDETPKGLDRRDIMALDLVAAGKSTTEAANEAGISRTTLWRLRNRDAGREYLEQQTARLMEAAPDLITTVLSELQASKILSAEQVELLSSPPEEEDTDKDKLRRRVRLNEISEYLSRTDKLRDNVLRALSIFPANSPNILIQTIINKQTNNTIINPEVLKVLGAHIGELSVPKEIDITPETEE